MADPATLAARIDFGIDLATGLHTKTPLDQIAARLTGLAQQQAWAIMASTSLRELVADGVGRNKERAIAENELANRIELARREAMLVEQEGRNERKKAAEIAAASRITAEGNARTRKIGAQAEAAAIKLVENERNTAESDRIAVYRDLAPAVLMGLAAREFAGKIDTIEHLNLTPDLLGTVLTDLLAAGTRRLETGLSEA